MCERRLGECEWVRCLGVMESYSNYSICFGLRHILMWAQQIDLNMRFQHKLNQKQVPNKQPSVRFNINSSTRVYYQHEALLPPWVGVEYSISWLAWGVGCPPPSWLGYPMLVANMLPAAPSRYQRHILKDPGACLGLRQCSLGNVTPI